MSAGPLPIDRPRAQVRIERALLARSEADPWVDPENDRLALLYELDGCRTEIARLRTIEKLAREVAGPDAVSYPDFMARLAALREALR